jgi:uncharacterized iron-regulated protein
VNADFQRYIEVEAELAQTEADVRAAEKLVNSGRISAAAFHHKQTTDERSESCRSLSFFTRPRAEFTNAVRDSWTNARRCFRDRGGTSGRLQRRPR